MAVDHHLRQLELRPALHAGVLEIQRRDDGGVPLQQQVERLIIHERAMLDGVVTGAERIFDPLGRAAVAGHLQAVIVGRRHHGVHFVERHAQRVVVVDIGRGRIAGGIRLDPLHSVLNERAHGLPRIVGAVDDEHQPFHADLAELGVPVHQPAGRADLASARGQPRSGDEVFLNRFLQPDVDIEQTAAGAGRRVAALQRQLRVDRRQQRDVLDRILDVEVFERGDVEVRGVKMRLDQPRHDGAAAGVDRLPVGKGRGRIERRTGVGDAAVLQRDDGVRHRRRTVADNQLPIDDPRDAVGESHKSKPGERRSRRVEDEPRSRPTTYSTGPASSTIYSGRSCG